MRENRVMIRCFMMYLLKFATKFMQKYKILLIDREKLVVFL